MKIIFKIMPDLELLKETTERLGKGFLSNTRKTKAENFDELHQILAGRILEMLRANLQDLLNLLYRIDIDETRVRQSFRNMSEEDIAADLATLVIQRELQKIEIRKKYSQRD
jgi:hypothetical protein